MNDLSLREEKLRSTLVYDGGLLHIYRDDVRLPNGETAYRELNRHVGAVCVIPVDDEGNVILERQFRYPIDQVLVEIPAGKLNSKEEDPEEAARRELREETGLTAGRMVDLGHFYPTPAYTDEKIHMFMALELSQGDQELDPDEFLEVFRLPLEELVEQVMAGEVPDIKTQAAALKAFWYFRREIELLKR